MATTTANTILKHASTKEGEFAKLLDITDYPDLGGTPNMLDTTDLSATKFQTSIMGLQEAPDLTFEANYDYDKFVEINEMVGTHWFNLEFGDGGADGVFEWSGEITIFTTGGGVDEVRKMTVVISTATPIEVKTV